MSRTHIRADVVLEEEQRGDMTIVEVKASEHPQAVEYGVTQLNSYAQALGPAVKYAMLVTPGDITLWRVKRNGAVSLDTLLTLPARECLSPYIAQDKDVAQIKEFYLSALVDVWLQDLLYHWKLEKPYGYDELNAVGFLADMQDAIVRQEVEL